MESGTLWIDWHAWKFDDSCDSDKTFRDGSTAIMDETFDSASEYEALHYKDDETTRYKKKVLNPDHIVYSNYKFGRDENDGVMLYYGTWRHFGICRPRTFLVNLTFVLPSLLIEQEEFVWLFGHMEHAMMNADIDFAAAPEV